MSREKGRNATFKKKKGKIIKCCDFSRRLTFNFCLLLAPPFSLFRLTATTQQQHTFSLSLSVCLSPPGSLLSISLNVYIFTQKNCGGELIAEIFVPLVCVRIIMVQKAKKKYKSI